VPKYQRITAGSSEVGANLVFESKHSVEEEREDILPFMKTCPCRYILPELHTPQPGGKDTSAKL
jgi:hypothetical protein